MMSLGVQVGGFQGVVGFNDEVVSSFLNGMVGGVLRKSGKEVFFQKTRKEKKREGEKGRRGEGEKGRRGRVST